jgi:hypothetical protein
MVAGMTARHGTTIQTFSGHWYYPIDPRPEDVDLRDVAHALALVNRFTGHSRVPYSVGQHSVLVSLAVEQATGDRAQALWGLLHDASEAYIADVARPVKQSGAMFAYREIEVRNMAAVCERFGLPREEPPAVKLADRKMLATERRDLLCHELPWGPLDAPYPDKIVPWSWETAEQRFLARFHELAPPGLAERVMRVGGAP